MNLSIPGKHKLSTDHTMVTDDDTFIGPGICAERQCARWHDNQRLEVLDRWEPRIPKLWSAD
jgi:hypothetical protein